MTPAFAAAVLAALAAALATPGGAPHRPGAGLQDPGVVKRSPAGRVRGLLPAGLAGLVVALVVGGTAGAVTGAVVAAVVARRLGDRAGRAEREAGHRAARELPHLVLLLAASLRGGASPGAGLEVACAALPGPAADRLQGVRARLALGVDPVDVWSGLAHDAALAPLGRTLARSAESGASVVSAVERLAEELAEQQRTSAEERARTVGVRAAVPLGVCLLPAFLLLGIVPLVAVLLSDVAP